MDQQRERVQDDLRGLVAGEVRCDEVFGQLYASDGSVYEIKPLGVVRPRSTADVVACVQYAADTEIPIHARGSGSGVSGESLGPGIVIDFSRHLRRVIRVDEDSVRVQPGLVCERLNEQLRAQGKVFGAHPATGSVTTVGGVLAVDAAGSRWLKYGSARRHVRSLQVVLADGELMEVGQESVVPSAGIGESGRQSRKQRLVSLLGSLLRNNAELIGRSGRPCPSDRCGYNLAGVLSDSGQLDLARLLVGSEGTLALITEATVSIEPLARHRGVALLLFESLEKASRAVMKVLAWQPSACDLMDRRHLSLAREVEVRFDLLIPPETEAVLLVEHEGDDPIEVRERVHAMVVAIRNEHRLAFGARQAFDQDETELFWRLATKIRPAAYPVKGPRRPLPFVEDVAVPPEALPEFFVRAQNVLKHHQLTASLYCHAGQGQLHLQPFLDLTSARDVQRMQHLAEELYQEVFDIGGTISGSHACGFSRTPFVRRQVGPLYDVFRQVKEIFDPRYTLNPGKVVGDDPVLLTRHLRPAMITSPPESAGADADEQPPQLRDLVELQLDWDPTQISAATRQCNRCGECRTQAADARMCPIFRVAPCEEASPRAKANLMAGVLSGALELGSLTSDEFKAVADLCFHCHACRLECPARVDIPRLVAQGKGAYVAANGLPFDDRVMTRLGLLSAIGSTIAPVANWAIGNRLMRWWMEKTLGIAQGRKLPRLATRNFLRRAVRRRLTRPTRRAGRKVVYFVDLYANYYDPQLAEALVAVMEHNGVTVYVPPQQRQAGMPAVATGDLDHARWLAAQNVAALAESVRQGYHVVATEPSAALCLTREYPQLIDDEDVRLVADNSSEACTYLWKLHTQGKLQLDLKPINASLGYHLPCHLKALEVGAPGENLLRLIPGLTIRHIEEGCSGMAGTFGLTKRNYRTSLRAGWALISRLRDPVIQAGVTECSTCKIQMEQGTPKPTIHPIKLLALAYGIMPEVAQLLTTPGEELFVT